MPKSSLQPEESGLSRTALEAWLAAGVVALTLVVPFGLVVAGYVPLPLDGREGMLPWALDGGAGRAGRMWDAMWWDGVAQFLSWRWILGDALRQGQVPYWSPWSFCGQPFAANGQSACFYPPAMVLCWLLRPGEAIAWLWVVHVALAVGLTGWLGRRMGLGWPGAVAAGVIYATGGFMLAWAPVQSLMMSAAWLPGALVGVELALHERRVRGAVLMALSLAMAVLAGHMQVAGYVWLATAAWAVGRLVFRAARGKPWPVAPIASGFVLALALSACQWLPTAELGMLSPRGGEKPTPQGFAFAQALALKPRHLAALVWPAALGLPKRGDYAGFAFAEHFLGLGPVTFVLAVMGLARMPGKRVCGLAVLGIVFLLVAMGTPAAALIYYHVPALGLTAGFQRTAFVFCLAWAVLAGLGLDWLMGGRGRSVRWRTGLTTVALVAVALQAAALIVSVLPLSRVALAERRTAVTEWLAAHVDAQSRVLAVTPRAAWTLKRRPLALLPPNTGAIYGLRDVQGYDSLYPRLYRDAAAGWEGADPAPMTNGNMVLLENVDAPELGRLGVRYVVTAAPIGSPRLRKVTEFEGAGGSVWVYERTDCEPAYRLLARGKVTALATGLGYGRISLEVPAGAWAEARTFEVAETPYPGWWAYADGEPVACTLDPTLPLVWRVSLPADFVPRAADFIPWPLAVAMGEPLWQKVLGFRLDLIYWPVTGALGQFLTLVGVAVAVGVLVCVSRRPGGP